MSEAPTDPTPADQPAATPTEDVRAAEARGDRVTVTWGEYEYSVPRNYGDWPWEYSVAIEEGKPSLAMKHLLGPAQYARFVSSSPTVSDFRAFDIKLGEAIGLEAGKSEASSD